MDQDPDPDHKVCTTVCTSDLGKGHVKPGRSLILLEPEGLTIAWHNPAHQLSDMPMDLESLLGCSLVCAYLSTAPIPTKFVLQA